MKPGQAVEIQLVDERGKPVRLRNVVPEIRLFTPAGGPPRYSFDGWPTDESGCSVNTFADLEEERAMLGLGDLMDYNTPLTDCAQEVEVAIPPGADFENRKARLSQRLSRWRPAWLSDWPANGCLAPVQPRRVTLDGAVTRLEIPVSLPTDD